ncbi:hypothetical protein BH23GEM3_BH23GEM3_19570 [soil metagenome]
MSRPKLLDQVREHIRLKHLSRRTEQAYVSWIRRFVHFHELCHPNDLGAEHVQQFLSHLAVEEHVAGSTQNQAFAALLFLYRRVLKRELGEIGNTVRAKRPKRLPVVFSRGEALTVLAQLRGTPWLVAGLLYGSGLRLLEVLRLRVKDVDFPGNRITVRDGKGAKDRIVMLPARLAGPLRAHLSRVRVLHAEDLGAGFGSVYLPYALAQKYPNASTSWTWQYLFPARQRSTDPRSGEIRRHHLAESMIQKAVKTAILKAGITKTVSCHTFRHSFATDLLEAGYDIRTTGTTSTPATPVAPRRSPAVAVPSCSWLCSSSLRRLPSPRSSSRVSARANAQTLRGTLLSPLTDSLTLQIHPAASPIRVATSSLARVYVSRGISSRTESALRNGALGALPGAMEVSLLESIAKDPDASPGSVNQLHEQDHSCSTLPEAACE